MKISGSVEEGAPPGSDASGAAPGNLKRHQLRPVSFLLFRTPAKNSLLCPDNMEKKCPLFLHFGARYGIFYTGKPFRVGKLFVASAVPLNNDRKE